MADTKTAKPPYRADIVGSFLRPDSVKQARKAHQEGKISAANLRAAEDAAIDDVIQWLDRRLKD